MYLFFKTKTPSQNEIFSEKLLLFCILAFQNYYSLQKWNIFSKLFFVCSLCSHVCIGLWRPKHLLTVKFIFLKYLLAFQHWNTLPKWNIFSNVFSTKTPSQSEIFFRYCNFLNCIFAFEDFCLFSLLTCMYWPLKTETPSHSEIYFFKVSTGLSTLKHPPKVKYLFKCIQYQNTLPKWNIFSLL